MKTSSKLPLLLLSYYQLVSPASPENIIYIGKNSCPSKPSIKGYTDLSTLINDMYYDAHQVYNENQTQHMEYTYVLCPDAVYNVESVNFDNTILPYLDNTTVMCGGDENDCVLVGGPFQIAFHPELMVSNVTFVGLHFMDSYGVSVGGWAHPLSSATFRNCHWEGNRVDSVVELYFDPLERRHLKNSRNGMEKSNASPLLMNHRIHELALLKMQKQEKVHRSKHVVNRRTQDDSAMNMTFYDCVFKDNECSKGVILNAGGVLELFDTHFYSNSIELFVVGTIMGGHLFLHSNNTFMDNQSTLFTVFVDSKSFLQLNEQQQQTDEVESTVKNLGITCTNGIFLENQESFCIDGGVCHGSCCVFGNNTCDLFFDSAEKEEVTTTSVVPHKEGNENDIDEGTKETFPNTISSVQESSSSNDKAVQCGDGCIAFAVVVPVLVVGLILVGLQNYKRSKRNSAADLGNAPEHPLA